MDIFKNINNQMDLQDDISRNVPSNQNNIYQNGIASQARRAERDTSLLSSKEEINIQSLIYLNRLSDLLFVLCRVLNENGLKDILWIPGLNQK